MALTMAKLQTIKKERRELSNTPDRKKGAGKEVSTTKNIGRMTVFKNFVHDN